MTTLPPSEQALGHIFYEDGTPVTPLGSPLAPASLSHAPGSKAASGSEDVVGAGILETGVKVVDVFTPLRLGGLHQVSGGVGVGKDVLLGEIIHNVGYQRRGCAVWVAPQEHHAEGHHLVQEFRECGVLGLVAFVVARPGKAAQALQAGLALARSLAAAGRETLLGIEADLLDASAAPLLPQHDTVTRLIITQGETVATLPAPLTSDGDIRFSRALAERGIWPAVDVVRSHSGAIERGALASEHLRVAREARDSIVANPAAPRALRLLRFGSQPFFVAEPFTAQPGQYVPLAQAEDGYQRILRGDYDDAPEEALTFLGALPPAR